MTTIDRVSRCLAASAITALVLAAGCNGEVAVPEIPKADNKANKGTGPVDKAPSPKADPDAVSPMIYPDLPVHLLNAKERAMLVKVTDAELCPCPKASVSMHVCLQKRETQCGLATSAALVAMQKIKEGNAQADALAAVGAYIEASYKVYDFKLDGVAYKGNLKAPVVIVEFADFECPFCNLARGIVNETLKAHGDNVVVYFKQFPLSTHQFSFSAASACLAAQKQGKFWEMYDLLFDNQKSLSEEKIKELATVVGLNMDQFLKDWKDPAIAARVEAEKQEGVTGNVDATPSFFINGRKYLGDKTPEGLVQAVGEALKNKQ